MNYTKTLRNYCLQNSGKLFDAGYMAEKYFPIQTIDTEFRGKSLREQRMRCGMSAALVSELLQITPGTLYAYETGTRPVKLNVLYGMSQLYDVSIDELIRRHFLYMNSQMTGVFDVSFAAANGMENDELSNLLRIPLLLKSPETIVEALYWVDDIVSQAKIDENKSLLISQAYTAERLRLLQKLAALPEEPNRNIL